MRSKAIRSAPPAERPIREKAYLLVQQKLLRGELLPGSPISEVSLAQELGSSRTPVREALGQLVAEGLLDQTPSRGTVVVQLRRQDIIDLYELREALEVYAAGKAARRLHSHLESQRLHQFADEILRLRSELENSSQPALNANQMQRFVACDLGFHSLLVRMAANARISKTVNETRLLIRIFAMHRRGHDLAALTRIHAQHEEILRSVLEQKPEDAMRALSSHIQESQSERLEEFDHWEHEASLRQSLPVFFDFHHSAEQV